MAKPFTPAFYSPLETKRTIRLMAIWPGKDDEPICCGIYQESLDSPKLFFALSYTWGSPSVTKPIYCHFAETTVHHFAVMQVTINLYNALRRLRDPTIMIPLWVDALCINQADKDEKGHQVGMMCDIYSRAGIVHVWLGQLDCAVEATKAIRLANEFITPEVQDLFPKPYADVLFEIHCAKLKSEGKPTLLDFDWTPVQKLLQLPWWRRKWVIQETARARRVLMYFGTEKMIYEEMMNLFDQINLLRVPIIPFLKEYGQDDIYEDIRYGFACAVTMFEVRHLKRPIPGPTQLLQFLSKLISFQCTDTRDHIYAVLGLGWQRENEDFHFPPDYSLGAESTFIRFAIQVLKQSEDPLYFLYYHTDQRRPQLLQLPSWVPDWTRQDVTSKLSGNFTGTDPQLFKATLDTRPVFHVHERDNILSVRGLNLDSVKAHVASLEDDKYSRDEFSKSGLLEQYFTNWRIFNWYKGCLQLAVDLDSSLDNAFHTALLCEIHTTTVDSKHRIRDPEFWGAVMSNLMYRNAGAVKCALEGDETGATEYLKRVVEIEGLLSRAINKHCLPRSFFTTLGGRIGQGPKDLGPGDVICLFYGGRVPYVVRPVGDGTFTFVGHCYLQGVMDGEAMELGLQEIDIRLR